MIVICVPVPHDVNKPQHNKLHHKFSPDKFSHLMGREKSLHTKGKKSQARIRQAPAGTKRTAGSAKRGRPWSHVQCIYFLAGISFALTLLVSLALYLFILLDIPNLKSIRDYEPKMTTQVIAPIDIKFGRKISD